MTESAAYALSLLPQEKRKEAIRAYFGEDGSGYTLIRTHIDSCDFALGMYQAVPDSDPALASFSIERDRQYILPALREAMEAAEKPVSVLLSPWSPPASWKNPPSMLKNIHSREDLKKLLPRSCQMRSFRLPIPYSMRSIPVCAYHWKAVKESANAADI